MKSSRNEEELRHVWTQWRDVTGKNMKQYYERFVELSNEAAKLNSMTLQISQLAFNSAQIAFDVHCRRR